MLIAAALTNYTLPSGKAVVQGVDGLGRVTSVSLDGTNIASGFTYHPNGSVAGVTYGNGQVFSQTLTPRQQTDWLRSVLGAELPVDLTYTYSPRSQIASINDQTVPNIDQAFTYDGIGRLTASTGPWGAGTFQYDGLGNIRQRAVGARTVGMSYNAANQLSAHTDTALAVPAPVSMTALYDGASRRVKQVTGGVTRYSVYDASGTLIEIDEVGGAKTDYIRASGMTLARIAGSTVTWLHHDHLGSAVAGTNASGAVVWRESEQPFGEDWTSAAANDNQAGYTGHVEDAATGLTYMQARYYDPVIGRFLSIDPVGFSPERPDMFNRYAYAANDPVNMWDPFGNDLRCAPSGGGNEGPKQTSCGSHVLDENEGDKEKPKKSDVVAAVAEAGAIKYEYQARAMEAAAKKQGPITKYTSDVIDGLGNVGKAFTTIGAAVVVYETANDLNDGDFTVEEQADLAAGAGSLGVGMLAAGAPTGPGLLILGGALLVGEYGDNAYETGYAVGKIVVDEAVEQHETANDWIMDKYVYSREWPN